MATYLSNNFAAIDFTDLSNTNIFNSFFNLLITGGQLIEATGG